MRLLIRCNWRWARSLLYNYSPFYTGLLPLLIDVMRTIIIGMKSSSCIIGLIEVSICVCVCVSGVPYGCDDDVTN